MTKNDQHIVDLLQGFGLSANACKAYITLLKNYPATGYEVSAQSGIPRSAIYAVLNRLQDSHLVNAVGTDPKRYIPIPPSALLEYLEHSHTDRLENLRVALEKLNTDEEAFDFCHLHGQRNLILKMREVITNAKQKVFLSIWRKDYRKVLQELTAAHSRGVEIILFSFCELPPDPGIVVAYHLDEKRLLDIWNPKVILVADRQTTIMGSTLEGEDSRAIWTRNPAITEIAINHIILDITLAGQRLGRDLNQITQQMMKRPDINLDSLLKETIR